MKIVICYLYLGGSWFEFRTGHWLSWLRLLVVFLNPPLYYPDQAMTAASETLFNSTLMSQTVHSIDIESVVKQPIINSSNNNQILNSHAVIHC
jgi:hypothetical protein